MKVKKIGHCCLVIDVRGNKIMTDPGTYGSGYEDERDLCAVVITHEHADHFHIDSLRKVLSTNPQAIVVTNSAVGEKLRAEGVPFKKVEDSETQMVNGVLIEGYGSVHARVHESMEPVMNTGYFIDNTFFYPGDAFFSPQKPVELLALPVAGPWMKLEEAIAYAELVKPKRCFPVHDGALRPDRIGIAHKLPKEALDAIGVEFVVLLEGEEVEFEPEASAVAAQ